MPATQRHAKRLEDPHIPGLEPRVAWGRISRIVPDWTHWSLSNRRWGYNPVIPAQAGIQRVDTRNVLSLYVSGTRKGIRRASVSFPGFRPPPE